MKIYFSNELFYYELFKFISLLCNIDICSVKRKLILEITKLYSVKPPKLFQQINGDVVVAFYEKKKMRFRAEDYYISSLSQCDGKQGACPDERIGGKNDAVLRKIVI